MKVSLNPIPSALIESLRSIGYTVETALADLIDNSITAKAKHISIRYLWNNGRPWIAVCDDGDGMSAEELPEAMRLGSRNPKETRSVDDLGRFGLGMKTASISQCRQMTVISWRGGKIAGCKWVLDTIAASDSLKWEASMLEEREMSADVGLNELLQQHRRAGRFGTIVLWHKLDPDLGDR